MKEEAALKALRNKLAVFELEQNIGQEVNKVDCLEEEVLIRDMDDEVMRITKLGYAQAQDPLIKVNIDDEGEDRPTFVSQILDQEVSNKLIALLKKYKDCFVWEYEHISGLDMNLVEHGLPTKPNFKPHKQSPRRFSPNVLPEIKKEIERLLKAGFIRTARYVEWLSNIVSVLKKNGKLRVCIDFRNLNLAAPKDEYPIPTVDSLVDSTVGHVIYSFMDVY